MKEIKIQHCVLSFLGFPLIEWGMKVNSCFLFPCNTYIYEYRCRICDVPYRYTRIVYYTLFFLWRNREQVFIIQQDFSAKWCSTYSYSVYNILTIDVKCISIIQTLSYYRYIHITHTMYITPVLRESFQYLFLFIYLFNSSFILFLSSVFYLILTKCI